MVCTTTIAAISIDSHNPNPTAPHHISTKTTRWTPDETRRFYMALRQCGTDFTTMELMFPHRDRAQLKVRVYVFACVQVCVKGGGIMGRMAPTYLQQYCLTAGLASHTAPRIQSTFRTSSRRRRRSTASWSTVTSTPRSVLCGPSVFGLDWSIVCVCGLIVCSSYV